MGRKSKELEQTYDEVIYSIVKGIRILVNRMKNSSRLYVDSELTPSLKYDITDKSFTLISSRGGLFTMNIGAVKDVAEEMIKFAEVYNA